MYGEGVRVAEDSDEFVTKDFDVRRRQRRRKGVWAYYVRRDNEFVIACMAAKETTTDLERDRHRPSAGQVQTCASYM